jgi:hypothetical protein
MLSTRAVTVLVAHYAFISLISFLWPVALLGEEGTRHVTGQGVDLYFMNDKLFGSVEEHPVWGIYRCAEDITGEIDIDGTYHQLNFQYHGKGDRILSGTFGSRSMALGKIEKANDQFIYHVFVDEEEYTFTIHYEQMENEHMMNSVINGSVGRGKEIELTVDGHLCPFATTGIILIVAGSLILS